jgi:hypothetical protein
MHETTRPSQRPARKPNQSTARIEKSAHQRPTILKYQREDDAVLDEHLPQGGVQGYSPTKRFQRMQVGASVVDVAIQLDGIRHVVQASALEEKRADAGLESQSHGRSHY